MRDSRRLKKQVVGGISGIVVVVALAIAVIPAIGSVGDPIPPASTTWGVTPTVVNTGGQSNDCQLFGGSGLSQYRIDSPKTQTYSTSVNGQPVSFALTIATGQKKDKYFDFTITGGVVSFVGVKGGSETAKYDYLLTRATSPQGPVTSDKALHATLDNQNKLYNVSNVTFCFTTAAGVSGTVFDDADGDGVKDSGEAGVSGRTVRLYGGTSTRTATTDANGLYGFAGVTLGVTYTVCQVPPGAAFGQTLPVTTTPGSEDCSVEGNRGYRFLLTGAKGNLDFGNVETATVSGSVFDDVDGDGTDDGAGEPGLARTVTLYRNGSSVGTMESGADGSFAFTGKPVGTGYLVCVTGSDSLLQTVPTGDANCPSEGNRGYAFPLASGGSTDNVFGFIGLATVQGRIFDDVNANGVDDSEGGVSGRTVNLYKGAALADSETTNGSGGFTFDPQTVGSAYTVCVVGADGRAQTYPVSGTQGSAACSGAGETAFGWGFTLTTGGQSNLGFGSVAAFTGSCAVPFGIEPNYVIQIAGGQDPCQKAFIIAYADTDAEGGGLASLQPVSGQGLLGMIERITWTVPSTNVQFNIQYDDVVPFGDDVNPMLYCTMDPRVSGSDFDIQPQYLPGATPGPPAILGSDPANTSCIVTETTTTTLPRKYTAYIYSSIDGLRLPTG